MRIKIPEGGLIGKVYHMGKDVAQLHIPLYAANAGFFIVLSVFPILLLLLSALRYAGLRVENLVELLRSFLPSALMESAENLIYSTYQNSTGAMLGLSAFTALWRSEEHTSELQSPS